MNCIDAAAEQYDATHGVAMRYRHDIAVPVSPPK